MKESVSRCYFYLKWSGFICVIDLILKIFKIHWILNVYLKVLETVVNKIIRLSTSVWGIKAESHTYSENSMCKILGTRGWKDGYFFQIVRFSHSLRIWEEYAGSITHRAEHRRREMHFSGGSYVHSQMRTSTPLRKQNEQVTFYYLCRWTKIPAHYP